MSPGTSHRRGRDLVAAVTPESVVAGHVTHRQAEPQLLRWAARRRDRAIDGDDPRRLAGSLATLLREQRLGRHLACLALPDSLLTTVLTDLPVVDAPLVDAVVGRRVREELGTQTRPLLADHMELRVGGARPDEHDDATRRAFVSWGDQERIVDLLEELEARRIRVDRLVPLPLTLLDRFTATRPDDPERLEAFLHLSDRSAVIGVTAGRRLLYARFLADVVGDELHEPHVAAVEEVRHTARFVRENHRGRQPETIWLAGMTPEDEARCRRQIEEQLELPARAFVDGEPADHADAPPADVRVALSSVAWHVVERPRDGLDVIPGRSPWQRWVLGACAVLLLGFGAVSRLVFDDATGRLAEANAQARDLDRRLAELNADERERRSVREDVDRREVWTDAARRAGLHRGNPIDPLFEAVARLPERFHLASARLEDAFDADDGARSLRLSLTGDLTGDGADVLRGYTRWIEAAPWCARAETHTGDIELSDGEAGAAREEILLRAWLR